MKSPMENLQLVFGKKPWIDQFNRTQTLIHLFLCLCLPNSLGLPV